MPCSAYAFNVARQAKFVTTAVADYGGNDLPGNPVNTANTLDLCKAACAGNAACKAFTLTGNSESAPPHTRFCKINHMKNVHGFSYAAVSPMQALVAAYTRVILKPTLKLLSTLALSSSVLACRPDAEE